jgi:hypothetical protein
MRRLTVAGPGRNSAFQTAQSGKTAEVRVFR